jgi:hypothetical protein
MKLISYPAEEICGSLSSEFPPVDSRMSCLWQGLQAIYLGSLIQRLVSPSSSTGHAD